MSVARASAIMISTLVASRILGWLRLSIIGARFGETPELDAFWAAFKIPDAIFGLLVAGALASAFIPVFAGYLAREREEEAWRVASSVLNALLILLVAFSAVMLVAAPVIVPTIVAPGFAQKPGQLALTIELTRLMLLSPIFMGLSSLTTGILNSYRQFLSGATAPLVYNAVQLMLLPLGVFSIAISAAIFPTLSHYASLGQVNRMRDAVQQAIRWILFLTLPTAILMIVLRRPIVNLLFQYGAFGAAAREATQAAFLFYSLGLAGHALIQILARAYYASRDTTTPLALTLISIGLNVVLDLILGPIMGINGLALANSIATLVEAVLLFTLLASRARLRLVGLGFSSLKQICASLLMGVAMFGFIRATNLPFDLTVDPSKAILLLQTILAAAVGGLAYLAAAYVLRIGELGEILAVVRARLVRGPRPSAAIQPRARGRRRPSLVR